MADGTTFCTKCGAKMTAAAPRPIPTSAGAAAAPAQQQKSGGSAVKIVLIAFAVILVLGMATAIGGFLFVRHKIKEAVHTDSSGNVTSVNIGGTKIETLKDSRLVAEKLGVDVYPGATPDDTTSSSMTIGGLTTTHAQFSTTASADEVFDFYKNKYPDANVTGEQSDNKTLVMGSEDKELLTINVTTQDDKTLIHITKLTKGK